MPNGLNDTNLVLILKKKNPTVKGDLHPIALCNVLCKVITKILADRLKGFISNVISDAQSSFISGFSGFIGKYEINKWLHGCKVAKGAPVVSHMIFADDSYLYYRSNEREATEIIELLTKFEQASG
uniref:Reverse transcriptase n=1 Tax=Cannabis sativa TaxID=3483 RepID=A0A803QHV8_CANSA